MKYILALSLISGTIAGFPALCQTPQTIEALKLQQIVRPSIYQLPLDSQYFKIYSL